MVQLALNRVQSFGNLPDTLQGQMLCRRYKIPYLQIRHYPMCHRQYRRQNQWVQNLQGQTLRHSWMCSRGGPRYGHDHIRFQPLNHC